MSERLKIDDIDGDAMDLERLVGNAVFDIFSNDDSKDWRSVLDQFDAELARLRAEAEAWRAVRDNCESDNPTPFTIINAQITRLDQLAKEGQL